MSRILLADDEPEIRRAYERVLKRAQLDVVTASDGATALAAVREQPFDAIVSDISMPGMTGLRAAARRARARSRRARDPDDGRLGLAHRHRGRAVRGHARSTEAGGVAAAHRHGAARGRPLQPGAAQAAGARAAGRRGQAARRLGGADQLLRAGDGQAVHGVSADRRPARRGASTPTRRCCARTSRSWPSPSCCSAPPSGSAASPSSAAPSARAVARAAAHAPADALLFVNLHAEDLVDEQLCDGDVAAVGAGAPRRPRDHRARHARRVPRPGRSRRHAAPPRLSHRRRRSGRRLRGPRRASRCSSPRSSSSTCRWCATSTPTPPSAAS